MTPHANATDAPRRPFGRRLARAAGVKSLAIFHHDPDHEDQFMEKVESDARKMWSGTMVAREHMRITLA